jgi:hypothetical protein
MPRKAKISFTLSPSGLVNCVIFVGSYKLWKEQAAYIFQLDVCTLQSVTGFLKKKLVITYKATQCYNPEDQHTFSLQRLPTNH